MLNKNKRVKMLKVKKFYNFNMFVYNYLILILHFNLVTPPSFIIIIFGLMMD